MLGSTLLQSPASSSGGLVRRPARYGRTRFTVVRCLRDYSSIPYRGPLKPTWLERIVDELPFVQRTKEKLSDYCTKLEGEECCSCWEAYFEIQDLEKIWSEEKLKEMLQSYWNNGLGYSHMINGIHLTARIEKQDRDQSEAPKGRPVESSRNFEVQKTEPPMHIPDGIPKSQQEIEEEEKGKMPDSYWTNFLRSMHIYPSWYTERPDVEYS